MRALTGTNATGGIHGTMLDDCAMNRRKQTRKVGEKQRACLGEHLTAESLPGLMTRSDWTQDAAAVPGTSQPGSFLIAQSLEPFSNQSALLSGTNTSSSEIFLELNFDPTQTANIANCVLDSVVCADCLITVSAGEMNISF